MTQYDKPDSNIHVIARGLLTQGNKIILCQVKDASWYFLPGGHVENGESAKAALSRELVEEIAEADYRVGDFIGVCENTFELKPDLLQHEINLVFQVDVPEELKVEAKEGHIGFIAIDRASLKDHKIMPTGIKEGLIEWLDTNKPFFK
ncbi:MAG TPA: NUDIX domain-containing protein [Flavobacterium sp.]|nr:NUDIX domain-containing protein [Flavobacterium sp.]